ncbi:hypothetical protein, partial [Pectobacterium odoriferum]
LNNIIISCCYLQDNSKYYYNNNYILKEVISLKIEHNISDLYLEFYDTKPPVIITPVYNTINDDYFDELRLEPFTLGIIKKLCNERSDTVRLTSMMNYFKLLNISQSFLIIQYFIFYNLMAKHESLEIYRVYRNFLDEKFSFSTKNNRKFIEKALFKQFSMKEVNLEKWNNT